MTSFYEAQWNKTTPESYDSDSYNFIVGIGEAVSNQINISEDEIYILPAKDHSLNIRHGEETERLSTYPEPPTIADIKEHDGESLMHLTYERIDIGSPFSQIPHQVGEKANRSNHFMWLTTDKDAIEGRPHAMNYEPSEEPQYEARLGLTSNVLEEEIVETEVDSTTNSIRKILGKDPETVKERNVLESAFKGTLESQKPETKEIVEEFYPGTGEIETNW